MRSTGDKTVQRFSIHRRTGRSGMATGSTILGAVLWCAVIISLVLIFSRDSADQPDPATAPETEETAQSNPQESAPPDSSNGTRTPSVTLSFPAQAVPEFQLEECMGGEFGLEDLRGRPWVAGFIFTRCITTCPQITRAMKELHDRVEDKNPDAMFVTMTVDSKFDDAEILQRYSETFQPDRDRWKFLTGDMESMHELIVDGFGIYVKENIGEARRPGMEVAHSNRVVLVNADGIPVGTFLGTSPEDMAKLAAILTGRKPFPEPGPPIRFSSPDLGDQGIEIQLVPAMNDDDNEGQAEDQDAEKASSEEEESAADESTTDETATGVSDSPDGLTPAERTARIDRLLPDWARALPTANAVLNTTSTILLTLGWLAIRSGRRETHRSCMIAAFVVSIAFLGCYLTSHWALDHYASERGRPFTGGDTARIAYYVILVPHVLLAATVPFLAIRVFQHAAAERWPQHRRLARVAFPVWMYVSVTGVMIYGMLYHWPQTA